MAVKSNIVARFGFYPTFCHFDTYTRSAKFDYNKLKYRPVQGAEALQWRPGRAGERRQKGTPESELESTELTDIRPDRPVPDQTKGASKKVGVRRGHWIYVFAAKRAATKADWYAELFAIDEVTTALNPKTTRADRMSWAPSDKGQEGDQPPANVNYSLNGRDMFVTAVAVPYRLSDACLEVLEAELLVLADFVEVSKGLRAFTGEDGSASALQWLEIPVLHPWSVAVNLADGIREARSRHSRRNGMPGEDPDGFANPPLQATQAESESCKQYALMSALVALMKGSATLEKEISGRFEGGESLTIAKRSLKTRPYEQLRYHVEAELLGADLAGWLSRRLVRILMDGYIIPPGPTSMPDIQELMMSLSLAAVALKYTSTGLEFLRVLRKADWRGTLLGSVAAPSEPKSQERIEHARPYVDTVLAIGTVALSARVLLEGAKTHDVAVELTALFGSTFGGDWKGSLHERERLISHHAFWGSGFGEHNPKADDVKMRARRLELKRETTARLESISGGVEKALKVLDAINLVLAVRELHEISESNPKLRNEKMADVVFQSLDFVKSVLEYALKGEKGVARLAPRILGVILAARTAWKSALAADKALTYGDINAFAAMAVTTVTSVLAIGVAAIGEAGAAAAHFGAIVAAIGVLASLLYVWAKDSDLETFVAHSSIGNRAFKRADTGEPGWATVPLNKLASAWDSQLQALAALQGQFSLYTDSMLHHGDVDISDVRLRPGILGSASRFIATWMWKDVGDAPHAPMRTKEVRIEAGEGMSRDDDGLYIDIVVPTEVFNKATDAGKPIPPHVQLSVIRQVYAADGVKVTVPLHGPAVMDCIRNKKSPSEKIRSMDITKPKKP